MSKILCPVDFKESSLNAVQYAANLARRVEAELVILHVKNKYMAVLKEGDSSKGAMGDAEEALEAMTADVRREFEIPCSYRSDYADLLTDIQEITAAQDFGLIVMGTNGISNLIEYEMGSTTAEVALNTRCALLCVPIAHSYQDPEQVVFAVDDPSVGHQRILEVITFARAFNSDVSILHIDRPGQSEVINETFKNSLMGHLDSSDWLNFVEFDGGHTASDIINYMNNQRQGLLAISTRHLPEGQQIFHESITKTILETADFPVLVFHQ